MKKWILAILAILMGGSFQSVVYASELLFEVGFRQQFGAQEGSVSGQSVNAASGFQLGASGVFDINGTLGFRSGLFYTEKPVKVSGTGSSYTAKFSYLQVPLNLMAMLNDYSGIYGGINLDFNLDADCGGSECTNVTSMSTPIVIGATFKFAPQLGANIFFETSPSKAADGLKDFKAVGANLQISFE